MQAVFKLSLLSAAFFFHSNSYSNSASINLDSIERIVTTANKVPTSHNSLVGNTSTLDRDGAHEEFVQHLNQTLSKSAGTWLSRGNGQESLLSIRSPVLTGAGSCSEFLTLSDGLPLRANGFCNVNQLFDTHFEVASHIEVVKGNNSARYGSGAIHGMVNVLSPLVKGNDELSFEYASDDYIRGHFSLSSSAYNTDFRLITTLTSDAGYQDSSGYGQQKVTFLSEQTNGNWSSNSILTYTNLNQDTAGYLQSGEDAYKEKSLLKENAFPDAFRDSKSVRYIHEYVYSGEDSEWFIKPYFRWNQMTFLMHFLPGTPLEKNGHKSLGLNILNRRDISEDIDMYWGLDTGITKGYLSQSQASETEHPSAFLRGVLPQGKHYDYDVSSQELAAYLGMGINLSDQSQFQVNVRYDQIEYDYDNHMLSGNTREDGSNCGFGGCRYTRPDSSTDNFDDLSFSLGYGYTFENLTMFAKYDQSFRAPHTSELYRLQNGQVKSDVNSVDAEQSEIGLRLNLTSLFAELSIYTLEKENGIYQDRDRQYLNGVDTSHKGVELDVDWSITPNIRVKLASSYANHTYENSPLNGRAIVGNQIDTAPKLMGNVAVMWQVTESVLLESTASHIDKYYLDAANEHTYAGHTVLDLSLNWALSENLDLYFGINNALDRRYAERADFAFGNYRYFVGKPRSFAIKLNYQFD